MTDLTQILRPMAECGKPVIRIESYSDCTDSFNGNYYGTGAVISGSAGVVPFNFTKITNIVGFVNRLPRAITRVVSLKCNTQKVTSSRIWEIQGADLYPVWKMNELEDMLQAQTIEIDGEEIVYRAKDAPFTPALKANCKGVYILRFDVEECMIMQIYGCNDTPCDLNTSTYFGIPSKISNQDYYGDNRSKIASSYSDLLTWYQGQDGVTKVSDIGGYTANCSFYKVFSVQSNKPVIPAFYYSAPIPANKVFGVVLNDTNPDYNLLCNGVDNTVCDTPSFGTPTQYEIICEDVIIGIPVVMQIGGNCDVELIQNWVQGVNDTSIIGGIGLNSINISAFNADYKSSSGDLQFITTVAMDTQCTFNIPDSVGSTILSALISTDHGTTWVSVTGYSFNSSTGVLNVTGASSGCFKSGNMLQVNYDTVGSSNYVLQGQVVAKINGSGCLPLNPVYIDNSVNGSIPSGSTVIINPDGTIQFVGAVTESDGTGSTIDVTNLIYPLN